MRMPTHTPEAWRRPVFGINLSNSAFLHETAYSFLCNMN